MKKQILSFLIILLFHSKSNSQTATFKGEVIDGEISIGYGVTSGDVDGDGKPDILLADKTEIVWYKNPGEKSGKWVRYVIAKDLTEQDNVCIAARDIDGDGKVEILSVPNGILQKQKVRNNQEQYFIYRQPQTEPNFGSQHAYIMKLQFIECNG